jgi:ubiquinone/menaquinone biosynthesis C-methylase UbiE
VNENDAALRRRRLSHEAEQLARSWMQYEEGMLRDYLVAGVEDPRLNVQSVLTRHFLTVTLFGDRFKRLFEEELEFAINLNWAQAARQHAANPEDLLSWRHALELGADHAEEQPVPRFAARTWARLPTTVDGALIPNYLKQVFEQPLPSAEGPLNDQLLAIFQRLWKAVLRDASAPPLAVLELACGSANDYRFFEAFGLARFLDYTGVDVCEKNIRNARAMFPQTRFVLGTAWDIHAPDGSIDTCLVQDLFEHLSLEALEATLAEIGRVTRQSICFGLFNGSETDEHVVRPVDSYYWNTLSVPCLRGILEEQGFAVEVIHIDTFLRWRFGCPETHNKNAYTLLGERRTS